MEGICSKIYHISLEYVKRIREKHLAILKENNIPGRAPGGTEGTSKAEFQGRGLVREGRFLPAVGPAVTFGSGVSAPSGKQK